MELDGIRQEIDRIDEQMKELFLQRMKCSRKVAEAKKQTGAAVFVKKREEEILDARAFCAEEEYLPECRAFFTQMMEISRLYQYSKLAGQSGWLQKLPQEEGRIAIDFLCRKESSQISAFLNGARISGLYAEMIRAREEEGGLHCKMRLSGNFSAALARGAVLMVLQESEKAEFTVNDK